MWRKESERVRRMREEDEGCGIYQRFNDKYNTLILLLVVFMGLLLFIGPIIASIL